jgi:Tfp pilus assembly protein PilN
MMNLFSFISKKLGIYIQIDRKHLKLIVSTGLGKGAVIKKVIAKPIESMSDEGIADLVREIALSNGVAFNNVAVIISREKAMIRHIRLPSVDGQEISRMVSFETTKHTPYSQAEVVSDYRVLGSGQDGYSDIMLVVSPKTEIARISDILQLSGCSINRIVLSSEAIEGWWNASEEDPAKPELLWIIDIDNETTEVAAISSQGVCFSRAVSIGVSDLVQGEDQTNPSWSRLVDEIKRSVSTYQKENPKQGEFEFIVTGSNAIAGIFNQFLSTALNKKSSAIAALSRVTIADEALDDSGIPEDISVCAICGAPYMQDFVNLLPKEQKYRQSHKDRFKKITILSISAVLTCIFFVSILAARFFQKKQLLEKLEYAHAQIEPVVSQAKAKKQKLDIIKTYISSKESSLDVIYRLYELIPAGISLVDFNYDDMSKTVRFNGRADRMADVFSLVGVLEESDAFSNVQTRSVLQRQIKDSSAVDFQIRCNFVIQD